MILQNYSLRSWAKTQGVSDALISRLISGVRPGKSGRSQAIRAKLLKFQEGAK